MMSCRLSGAPMEAGVRWVVWLLASMLAGLLPLIAFPEPVLGPSRVPGFIQTRTSGILLDDDLVIHQGHAPDLALDRLLLAEDAGHPDLLACILEHIH